jgi:2-dehydropantoate 2-reductase
MHILIVGAGALGGLVGVHLAESGEDVILLEINRSRAKLLNETGLYLSKEDTGERWVRLKLVSSLDETGPVDLVFIAVKSYETEAAVRGVLPVVGPKTKILSMQNGIGNTDVMAGIVGPERVLSGITYHSIQHTGPNRLRYRPGIKPIQIAPYDGTITDEVTAVGEVFRRCGLATNVVENIDHSVWQKLLHNAVVNPVSALTGLTCRELLDDDDLQQFMRALCMEIIAVMRARGVPIVDEEDPYRPVVGSQTALGKNRPSMWQDLARGHRTEVDAINGAVVVEAKRLGLEAPLNFGLVRFIHSRERQKFVRKEEIRMTLTAAMGAGPRVEVRPTLVAKGGGMSSGRVPLQTAPKLRELLRDYFHDLQAAADDPARKVAWCSWMGPVEIVRALGLTPYFPENHAALIGASRQTARYIPRAMAEGFSQFANSAMTCDIGAMLAGHSPLVSVYGIAGPPRPDVVVYNTSNGHTLVRWFEFYGGYFRVPVFGLHSPGYLHEVTPIEVDAVAQQTHRMISGLESVAGRKLDPDRLSEVVASSAKASNLWWEIMHLARTVPSPITFFDLVIHMAPMVLLRGTPQAVEYYTILKAELEERIAAGQAAVPGERYRFYWEGPPIWCALRPLAKLFMSHRVAIVAATYPRICSVEGLDPANPVASMAAAYTGIFPNRSDEYKAQFLAAQFNDFGIDGVIYHDGRTAPDHSNVRFGLEVRLNRATNLPSIVIEADSHDMRLFSMEQVTKQLSEFVERRAPVGAGRA